MKIRKRRHFSLMEVMIAFALILFCLIPLIYPNLAIYQSQQEFIAKIKVDHAASLLMGELTEKLHRREIPFDQLIQASPTPIEISPESLRLAGIDSKFPYTVSLTAQKIKLKGENKGNFIAGRIHFTYLFKEKKKETNTLAFSYEIPIVKLKQNGSAPANEEPSPPNEKGPLTPGRRGRST